MAFSATASDRPTVRRLIYDFEWLVMQAVGDSEMAEAEVAGPRAPASTALQASGLEELRIDLRIER